MSKKEKLPNKLLESPANFTWDELTTLLGQLGYRKAKSAMTGGSRRRFVHDSFAPISLHEPHPQKVLKNYQVDLIIEALRLEGML